LHTYVKYRKAEDLLEYGKHHQSILDSTYYDFIPDYIEPDKYAMECSQYFDDFIYKYYFEQKMSQIDGFIEMIKKYKDRTYDGLEGYIEFIDINESNEFVKQIILTNAMNNLLEQDYSLVYSLFDEYAHVVRNITYQNFILKRIDEKAHEPILVNSSTELEKLNYIGEVFREIHQTHKGKVLYIDLWGTWCGGCINSFPYINKLREEFDNEKLEFVFLCIQSSKGNWEKVKSEQKLKGTHYLLSDDQAKILSEQFNFLGVPRYVVIDKSGNIFDANAKAPYSNGLKDELKSLLAM
jgi:thiol-disulfide isomerase/thioredoxin